MLEDPGTGRGRAADRASGEVAGARGARAGRVASRSEIEARLGAEAHLALVRAASRRRRERLAGMLERAETAREIEHRLALRCGRLEREMQAFVRARAGEATRGRQSPVSTRMGSEGWESAQRAPVGFRSVLTGASAGLLVAVVVIAGWRSDPSERPERALALEDGSQIESVGLEVALTLSESESHAERRAAGAARETPRPLWQDAPSEAAGAPAVRVSVREASSPKARNRSPRGAGDRPASSAEPCFFYAETARGGELRSVLGPCFGEWNDEAAAAPGNHRHAGRSYCRHHHYFGRAYDGSLTTASRDAAFAVSEGMLPPFVRQRVGYGALVLLSQAVPDQLACGLENRFGGDLAITRLSEPDTYAVESWSITGSAEDHRRGEFRMELSVDGGAVGDVLLGFEWL